MTESLIELDLSRCVRKVVVTADDVGDAHVDIVNDDTKVVRRRAIRASDDEIVKLAVVENYIALDQVFDDGRTIARRAKTNSVRLI